MHSKEVQISLALLDKAGFDAVLSSAMFVVTAPSGKTDVVYLSELKKLLRYILENPEHPGIMVEQFWRGQPTTVSVAK